MKYLIACLLLLSFMIGPPSALSAQVRSNWIRVSPRGERFRVRLPGSPSVQEEKKGYGSLVAQGKRYSVSAQGLTYIVWSLKEVSNSHVYEELDDYSELAWEALLKPLRDKLSRDQQLLAHMTYHPLPGGDPFNEQEYSIQIGQTTGVVRVRAEGSRFYVLAVLNATRSSATAKTFFNSFDANQEVLSAKLPEAMFDPALGIEEFPPRPLNPRSKVNYNQVFLARDTTHRAEVLYQPEPAYTEAARKYSVEGVVALGAVLSKEGQVKEIFPFASLPHGLTKAAIEAAQRIRFKPATKDGHVVSQYVRIENKFSLY